MEQVKYPSFSPIVLALALSPGGTGLVLEKAGGKCTARPAPASLEIVLLQAKPLEMFEYEFEYEYEYDFACACANDVASRTHLVSCNLCCPVLDRTRRLRTLIQIR